MTASGLDRPDTAQLGHLERLQDLAAALGDAVSVDDVARATLTTAAEIDGVVRVGLAVVEGGGREFRFVSTDQDALTPLGVRWCSIDGLADVPLAKTVRETVPVHVPGLDALAERYPHMLDHQRTLGVRSLVALPLASDAANYGGLLVCYGDDRVLDRDEGAFLTAFAAQVTQALRRGLAYQVQHTTSEMLQRSLLPRALPDVDGLALGAYYRPGGVNADVGGDWYDVLSLADGSVAISLGDVMGKGVPAAIVMGEVRSALRAYALLEDDPAVVLGRLDGLVTSLSSPDQIVTLVYGVISADRRTMRVGIAGHPPPLLVPSSGEPTVLSDEVGPALGLGAGPWVGADVPLPLDGTVLFYSDGLVENRQVDLFAGMEKLRRHLADLGARRRRPRELSARLGDLVGRLTTDDDVTVLAAAVTDDRRRWATSVELPGDPTAAGRARRFLTQTLAGWEVDPEVAETAQLCLSELVTNAVIHTGTPVTVTVRLEGDCLLVLVQDRGTLGAVRQPESYDPEAISGRGLTLVDALATAWSAEPSADGTTVWFELDLDPAPSPAE